jgi:hypothetical protein
MSREKPEQTTAPSAARKLDDTELIQDLEIEDAEDADAVKGCSHGRDPPASMPGVVVWWPRGG